MRAWKQVQRSSKKQTRKSTSKEGSMQLQNEQRWEQEHKSLELQLELKCYKAVEAERSKWEAQEAWWRKEIDSLRTELREVSYQRLNVTPLCPDHAVISQSNLQSSAGTIGLLGRAIPGPQRKRLVFYPVWLLPLGSLSSHLSTTQVIRLHVLIMFFLVTTAQRPLLAA